MPTIASPLMTSNSSPQTCLPHFRVWTFSWRHLRVSRSHQLGGIKACMTSEPSPSIYAVCRLVKQLNRAQSGITYAIENAAGAGRFPAIRAALGDPVLARAHELGSSSRRDTLLWTDARDPDDLQAHYHRSLCRPTSVGDLIAKGGFAPEWQAPAHLRHSKFGKFVSRKGSFAHRLHGSTPGSSMLLHNGVYEEAPTDIKCISMGIDANAVDFPEVSADLRRRIIGACVDSNVAR
eukprot:jgi/Tetstr1/448845/TSEL_036071.t1